MEEKNISRTELAAKLKKSKSFVSQLFSGDKALNLKMIAQFQEIFNAKFIPSFKDYSEFSSSKKYNKNDYINNNYKKITSEALKNIPIDLDFDILTNKKNSSKVKIVLEFHSNEVEEPRPGYMYSLVAEAEYNIKGLGKMNEEKQNRYILFTALPLAIAMARSHLYSVSSNFPYGHYLMPSIDLLDLFEKKFNEV